MIRYIIVAFLGGLIGVFLCNWDFFEFDNKVHVAELFALGITSLVGLHIAGKLSQQQSSRRSEKDFYISEIKDFKSGLIKIKIKNDMGSVPFPEAVYLFRDINHDITHLEELSRYSTFCKNIDYKNLRAEFVVLRQLITGISPVNDIIHIPLNIRSQADTVLDNMKRDLYQIILKVNSSSP